MVSSHPGAAALLVAGLALSVILLIVYYRGVWFLGPYYKCGPDGVKTTNPNPAPQKNSDTKGDPETESLIDSINKS